MRHADLIAQIPIFEGLSDVDREALASRLQERKYAPGEKVFSKDEKGTSMYVVLSGAVQIFLPPPPKEKDAPRVILKDARTGEYFGELALFDDKPRSASVEATMDTVLLELTREDFAEHLGRSKTAAQSIPPMPKRLERDLSMTIIATMVGPATAAAVSVCHCLAALQAQPSIIASHANGDLWDIGNKIGAKLHRVP